MSGSESHSSGAFLPSPGGAGEESYHRGRGLHKDPTSPFEEPYTPPAGTLARLAPGQIEAVFSIAEDPYAAGEEEVPERPQGDSAGSQSSIHQPAEVLFTGVEEHHTPLSLPDAIQTGLLPKAMFGLVVDQEGNPIQPHWVASPDTPPAAQYLGIRDLPEDAVPTNNDFQIAMRPDFIDPSQQGGTQ